MYLVYGKDNCPYCVQAKLLLESKKLPFHYFQLNVHYTRDELVEMFPNAMSVPQIVYDTGSGVTYIGGYTDLVKHFEATATSELADRLRCEVLRVTFTKADGSERVMLCTQNEELITVETERKTDRVIKESPDVARVFDLEKNAWRSFRYDSVKSFEVAEVE